MKHIAYIIIFWMLCLIPVASAKGQKLSDSEMKMFLTTATEKTSEYSNVFKNLTVEEIKTFEIFHKDGKIKTRKKIFSDLIIYEPENTKGSLGEFRNVREVDGEKIKNSEKRTERIFAELANAKSFEEELNKLNKESSRYDANLSIYGVTSQQYVPLNSNIISSFKFEVIGTENIEGKEAFVIKFQQTSATPNLVFNIKAPDYFEISNTFYRGTIWLDLKNHRILRLITEVTLESAKFTEPFVMIRQEYYYQPGDFEIYLPRKIVSENFNPQGDTDIKFLLKTGKAKLLPQLQTRLIMEYKNFSKFDVTVKFNREKTFL
jgi:hypothetical protein